MSLPRKQLKEADFPKRLYMCQQILSKADMDPNWLGNLWTSDEANFNLNGKKMFYYFFLFNLMFV